MPWSNLLARSRSSQLSRDAPRAYCGFNLNATHAARGEQLSAKLDARKSGSFIIGGDIEVHLLTIPFTTLAARGTNNAAYCPNLVQPLLARRSYLLTMLVMPR
jgi:hypothetical protein